MSGHLEDRFSFSDSLEAFLASHHKIAALHLLVTLNRCPYSYSTCSFPFPPPLLTILPYLTPFLALSLPSTILF
jgi:hypothetical protein